MKFHLISVILEGIGVHIPLCVLGNQNICSILLSTICLILFIFMKEEQEELTQQYSADRERLQDMHSKLQEQLSQVGINDDNKMMTY